MKKACAGSPHRPCIHILILNLKRQKTLDRTQVPAVDSGNKRSGRNESQGKTNLPGSGRQDRTARCYLSSEGWARFVSSRVRSLDTTFTLIVLASCLYRATTPLPAQVCGGQLSLASLQWISEGSIRAARPFMFWAAGVAGLLFQNLAKRA